MSSFRRSLLASVLLLAACSEVATGPDAPAVSFAKGSSTTTSATTTQMTTIQGALIDFAKVAGLMTCFKQPEVQVSQVVGPAGGTIQIWKHTLVIPKGALSANVTITAETVADSFNSVRFGPEGLKFKKIAKLTMDYYNCFIPMTLSPAYVVYMDEQKNIKEKLVSVDDRGTYRVIGDLSHFSRYAVAW